MHDSPPPYPGINPNYTPTYPAQPNGFSGQPGPQAPQAGFGGYPQAPAGSQPYPQAPGQQYPQAPGQQYPQAPGQPYPQAPGQTYPTLPPNGFNPPFQGPSAPSSE
jgi:hypothetical protein